MSKNPFEDIRRLPKKKIKEIPRSIPLVVERPIPTPPPTAPTPVQAFIEPEPMVENPLKSVFVSTPPISIKKVDSIKDAPRSENRSLWFLAVGCVALLLFSLSLLFSGATVSITPKIQKADLKENFIADKDSSEQNIPFQLMALSGQDTLLVQGTGTQTIEQKATGRVVIYNTYSSSSQKLIETTRLESTSGKIYRIIAPVTVPGTSLRNGETIPGSVEVTVMADGSGEEYNSTLTDFTIPGFKNDPKYSKFYGRSKTEISGGFKGTVGKISEEDAKKADDVLAQSLKDKLLKQVQAQIPAGFIFYPDGVSFSANVSEAGEARSDGSGLVPVTKKGTLYAFIFDSEKLTKKIAETQITQFDGSSIHIPELKNLKFTLGTKDAERPEDVQQITFSLEGATRLVWNLDKEKIVTALLGTSKDDFQNILSSYKNIDAGEVTLKPFWKTTLPKDASKISLIVQEEN